MSRFMHCPVTKLVSHNAKLKLARVLLALHSPYFGRINKQPCLPCKLAPQHIWQAHCWLFYFGSQHPSQSMSDHCFVITAYNVSCGCSCTCQQTNLQSFSSGDSLHHRSGSELSLVSCDCRHMRAARLCAEEAHGVWRRVCRGVSRLAWLRVSYVVWRTLSACHHCKADHAVVYLIIAFCTRHHVLSGACQGFLSNGRESVPTLYLVNRMAIALLCCLRPQSDSLIKLLMSAHVFLFRCIYSERSIPEQDAAHHDVMPYCLFWPSLLYLRLAYCLAWLSKSPVLHRWNATKPDITWERFQENKKKELLRLNGVYMKILDSNNVEYHEGRGTLIDAHTVDVDGKRYTVSSSTIEKLSKLDVSNTDFLHIDEVAGY